VGIAVLVNPANGPNAEATLQEVSGAARAMGMQIRILNASTIGEIEAAFAGLSRERPDSLFVTPDTISSGRQYDLSQADRDCQPWTGAPPVGRSCREYGRQCASPSI
jgi:hypothetical protein